MKEVLLKTIHGRVVSSILLSAYTLATLIMPNIMIFVTTSNTPFPWKALLTSWLFWITLLVVVIFNIFAVLYTKHDDKREVKLLTEKKAQKYFCKGMDVWERKLSSGDIEGADRILESLDLACDKVKRW